VNYFSPAAPPRSASSGRAGRTEFAHAIERRVRRALPAITDEDLAEAFERVSDGLVAEADEFQRSI